MRFKKGHKIMKGFESNLYKTGRSKMSGNYYGIRVPGYFSADKQGRVLEHVYFYQEYHQCCILPWGEIHHIIPVTEDYCNNMPWNLMCMMKNQHRKLSNKFKIYQKKDRSDTFCLDCGSNETYIDKRGIEHWHNIDNNNLCRNCWSTRYRNIKNIEERNSITLDHGLYSIIMSLLTTSHVSCHLCGSFKTKIRKLKHKINSCWYNYLHVFICHNCYEKRRLFGA
jgi:hypothetical protein